MVQWENENSVSVVSEKKVVSAVELKEGTTVVILIGTNRSALNSIHQNHLGREGLRWNI